MAEMKVLSDIKNLDGKIGVLTELTTIEKGNLVGAVNENVDKINVLNQRISCDLTDLTTLTNQSRVRCPILVNASSSVLLRLPSYVGNVTVQSPIKGQFFSTFFIQITNQWCYGIKEILTTRFSNTEEEISLGFTIEPNDGHVYLKIQNNTMVNGYFNIVLTQNEHGGVY